MKFFRSAIRVFLSGFMIVICFEFMQAQPKDNTQDVKTNNSTINNKAFEGTIKFIQETSSDTNYYTYHVKGSLVRLDIHADCNGCGEAENRILFDLSKNIIIAMQPNRKLFMNLKVNPYIEITDDNFKIIQSKNNKMIMGYKCYQWRVKNKAENTEIAYWVANDNFTFFDDFLKLWNRSEKPSTYFLKIPDSEGYFPLLSEERTTLRELKNQLRVLEINKTELDDAMFAIPKDFKAYDQ